MTTPLQLARDFIFYTVGGGQAKADILLVLDAALAAPTWVRQKPATPDKEGWYRVMHPGDSESIDGHTIYDFPDYEAWAYWTPAKPEELEEEPDGYKGSWATEHDEDGEGIFAYCGPVPCPPPFRLTEEGK